MMMKKIIIFLSLVLFITCKSETKKNRIFNEDLETKNKSEKVSNIEQFNEYLEQFPKIKLPVNLKGCDINYKNYRRQNTEEENIYANKNQLIVGEITTNGNYKATITLDLADCLIPRLTTYFPDGKEIDSKELNIGYCGDAPCYECIEYMILKKDYSIYVADTITVYDCDYDNNIIKGTEKIKIISKKGEITKKGIIELSNEQKKEYKTSK